MTEPNTDSRDAVYATAGKIAKTLNEPQVALINRIVWTLGVEQARALYQQTLDIAAQGGMMTLDGKRRRAPGGVFFKLVKEHIAATDKNLWGRIFQPAKKKRAPASNDKPKQPPAPPVDPLTWADALKYANALLKHDKGEARTVEVKLIGRPKNVAKAQSGACMVAVMEGKSAPKSLPKGLPQPPEQVQNFAVFISNKHWAKVSAELKANANAELLVKGHPVFNPAKALTMLLAQSVETIERKPKQVKEA